MIMKCFQNNPFIKMQLMQSPANGQLRIQMLFCFFAQDPDQTYTASSPDDEQDLFGNLSAWMKRSWTSNSLNTSRGKASKICGAPPPRTLNPQDSGLLHNKLIGIRVSLESACVQTVGSFRDDLQSMRLRATAHTCRMRDWNFYGLRTGERLGHSTR